MHEYNSTYLVIETPARSKTKYALSFRLFQLVREKVDYDGCKITMHGYS